MPGNSLKINVSRYICLYQRAVWLQAVYEHAGQLLSSLALHPRILPSLRYLDCVWRHCSQECHLSAAMQSRQQDGWNRMECQRISLAGCGAAGLYFAKPNDAGPERCRHAYARHFS